VLATHDKNRLVGETDRKFSDEARRLFATSAACDERGVEQPEILRCLAAELAVYAIAIFKIGLRL